MNPRPLYAAALTAAGAALVAGVLANAPFGQADPGGDPSQPCSTNETCVSVAPSSVVRTPPSSVVRTPPSSVVRTPAPSSVLLTPAPIPQ